LNKERDTMQHTLKLLSCAFFLQLFFHFSCSQEATVIVEHSLKPGTFTQRGQVLVQNIKFGSDKIIARFSQASLSTADVAAIKALAKNDGFYIIRAKLSTVEGNNGWVMVSTKATTLLDSGLKDRLELHFNSLNDLVALSYAPYSGTYTVGDENAKFNTDVFATFGREGTTPIVEPPPPTVEKQKQDAQENQSFVAKYWMYIVPVFLIMLMNTITGGAGAEEGAARPGGAAAPAGAAAAARPRAR